MKAQARVQSVQWKLRLPHVWQLLGGSQSERANTPDAKARAFSETVGTTREQTGAACISNG